MHLFETHSACELEIPPVQPALPEILITEIMYDPPGGTGEPSGRHTGTRGATNTIHHSALHPSCGTLPVVPR